MTEDEFRDALDGLFAYDSGSVDSGIHDEDLRRRCIDLMRSRRGPYELWPRKLIGRIVRDLYLSDEALEQGYGPEDAYEFLKWLDHDMAR